VRWASDQAAAGTIVALPEIADYEVRRELLRIRKPRGIARLDALKTRFLYLPLTTGVMLQAALFWAQARQQGRPTAAPDALDADVIVAAQAHLLSSLGHEVIVATENAGHLSQFADARRWQDI